MIGPLPKVDSLFLSDQRNGKQNKKQTQPHRGGWCFARLAVGRVFDLEIVVVVAGHGFERVGFIGERGPRQQRRWQHRWADSERSSRQAHWFVRLIQRQKRGLRRRRGWGAVDRRCCHRGRNAWVAGAHVVRLVCDGAGTVVGSVVVVATARGRVVEVLRFGEEHRERVAIVAAAATVADADAMQRAVFLGELGVGDGKCGADGFTHGFTSSVFLLYTLIDQRDDKANTPFLSNTHPIEVGDETTTKTVFDQGICRG